LLTSNKRASFEPRCSARDHGGRLTPTNPYPGMRQEPVHPRKGLSPCRAGLLQTDHSLFLCQRFMGPMELVGVWTSEANPNGIASHSPRVAVLGYLGTPDRDGSQPQRGCVGRAEDDEQRAMATLCQCYGRPQPLWGYNNDRLRALLPPLPRIAEYGNPGLRVAIPSGLCLLCVGRSVHDCRHVERAE
jgi:hypothetical protein